HASIITSIETIVGVLALYWHGVDSIQTANDVRTMIISPAYFLGADAHPIWRVLLENLNAFSLWYFALLALGISITGRLSKWYALFVVGLLWAIQIGALIGVAMIGARLNGATV